MPTEKIKLLCSHVSHLPLLYTLQHSGVTQEEGFELELDIVNTKQEDRPIRKMADRARCLLDGTYHFLSGLHHETYVYRARGDKRFLYLAQTQNAWDDRLITRADIKCLKQLEGKKVLTARVPCVCGNLQAALRQAGVDTAQVEFVFSLLEGSKYPSHILIDMIAEGKADAANVDIPFDLQATKQGLNVLALPEIPIIHNTTICASTDFVRAHEETTVAFLKALIRAIHFFKSQKSKVCEILSCHLAPLIHLRGDDEIEYLQEQWSQLLCAKPYPHPLAVWNVYNLEVAHDPEVNSVSPLEIWDTHYLREIDDSGFIDSLYGQKIGA
ncbi:MAG: ABC transporter substrate-binding protein [Gammaproteobacteria bacterium]